MITHEEIGDDIMMNIDNIIKQKKVNPLNFSMGYEGEKEKRYRFKPGEGRFIQSAHHKTKPKYIDDETWWVPNKSGKITKGYFEGYYYDAKKKAVMNGNKIIQKV